LKLSAGTAIGSIFFEAWGKAVKKTHLPYALLSWDFVNQFS
jgi:hypothetical protein